MERVPISSKYFGRPKGVYPNTREYITSCTHPASRQAWHEVYAAQTIKYNLPTPLDGSEVHGNFLSNQRKEMPPSYVYELENARFWGHYGGSVISSDDRLLGDLSHDVLGIKHHKVLTRFKLPRCRRLEGTVAVLATAEAATNYWHWTFDLLPRFHLLEKAGFPAEKLDYILVNHTDLPFQLETLAELGLRPGQIIRVDESSHFECGRMVVSSLKPSQLHVAGWVCDFLRRRVGYPAAKTRRNRRLYISRSGAAFRHLVNETEVVSLLGEHGFEKIQCEKVTVREQRRLFNEASFIVAPHGSGLTNLAYCQPGTKVLEIYSPSYVDVAFWAHASQSQLRHTYILGKGNVPEQARSFGARTADITVDPDTLMKAVRVFLESDGQEMDSPTCKDVHLLRSDQHVLP